MSLQIQFLWISFPLFCFVLIFVLFSIVLYCSVGLIFFWFFLRMKDYDFVLSSEEYTYTFKMKDQLLRLLDDSQQHVFERSIYKFKCCDEILCKGIMVSFPLLTGNLTTDWTQSFTSKEVSPFLQHLISSKHLYSLLFLLIFLSALRQAVFSLSFCLLVSTETPLPKDHSSVSPVEGQLPHRVWGQVIWPWRKKHGPRVRHRQMCRVYSMDWLLWSHSQSLKFPLSGPLLVSLLPEISPGGNPGTVGSGHSETLWKDSGKSVQLLLKDAKERKLFHGLTFTQS